MTTPYLDDLAVRLRAGGVPEDEVSGTVDDLAAHIAETGAAPEEEFGPVEEFAAGLVAEHRAQGGSEDGLQESQGEDTELQAPIYAAGKRFFRSKRFYTFVSCYAAFVIAVCAGWIAFGPAGSRTGFLAGFLLGAVIAAILMTLRLRQEHRPG
ncbi:hypothetical protein [Actinomadura verrucosospora]|uniref:Uncharacterized protein n=1 Tax=Actinomadura verrucosospora TaxID=46165 RepID=A0A7D4A6V0_ACTVE|nr:hypothetical protein [Actinomadura verrucosospora]QKG22447.1 hypothetical protein ACTIVE_4087 [Actinomadura verrucosospora]